MKKKALVAVFVTCLGAFSLSAPVAGASVGAPKNSGPAVKGAVPGGVANEVRIVNRKYNKCLTGHGFNKAVTLEKCRKGKVSQLWINYGHAGIANRDGFSMTCLAATKSYSRAILQGCPNGSHVTWIYNTLEWGKDAIFGNTDVKANTLQASDSKKVVVGKRVMGDKRKNPMWWRIAKP
ncbi:ricin-type beta-trefoil lectin domain protein [Streptomyces sp. NA04227]|uniref:ricin-type beta-trefoil lectin domain protein n=1 Tax=Streptomyces sp. NA04227 TaxID=2742136 RepID=UPI0015918BE6|nr:ricin-type beta-trefoil lectin domain protein [Streptomyces sp. NA04227]QKW08956.1 ricin-type beta-trefoil lectin domain protein [Streptomyces sp. NA04227]